MQLGSRAPHCSSMLLRGQAFSSVVVRPCARMQARAAACTHTAAGLSRARQTATAVGGGTPWQVGGGVRAHHTSTARATGTDGTTSTAPSSSSSSSTDERIKTTMADLDALLGIEEEPEATTAKVWEQL